MHEILLTTSIICPAFAMCHANGWLRPCKYLALCSVATAENKLLCDSQFPPLHQNLTTRGTTKGVHASSRNDAVLPFKVIYTTATLVVLPDNSSPWRSILTILCRYEGEIFHLLMAWTYCSTVAQIAHPAASICCPFVLLLTVQHSQSPYLYQSYEATRIDAFPGFEAYLFTRNLRPFVRLNAAH